MKANELMIGDWVRIKSDIEPDDAYWLHDMQPGQALKATEILSDGINPDWYDGEINDYVPEDAIEPIPLTPEILEKNGFSNNYIEDDLSYAIDAVGDVIGVHIVAGSWILDEVYTDYVHQLQHALRLCGSDKKITL